MGLTVRCPRALKGRFGSLASDLIILETRLFSLLRRLVYTLLDILWRAEFKKNKLQIFLIIYLKIIMYFLYYLTFFFIRSFNSGGIYFSSCLANILSAIKKFLSCNLPSATTPLPSRNRLGTVPT